MDYEQRIADMENHLAEHPKDYQTVIALLKMKSKKIEHDMKDIRNQKLQKVAHARAMLKAKEEQNEE